MIDPVSLTEDGRIYAPQTIAQVVTNLSSDHRGESGLSTTGYMAAYDWRVGTIGTGSAHGLGFASSLGGARELLLVRVGDVLYVHRGWDGSVTSLKTGLSTDPSQQFPDVCIPLGDSGALLWCNGIDEPTVVDGNGRIVLPLGFDRIPSSPSPRGPAIISRVSAGDDIQPPNHYGYSVPGNIGTISSDGVGGQDGALLASRYVYMLQLEDLYGNLSPMSAASPSVQLAMRSAGYSSPNNSTTYRRLNTLSDLQRQFAVSMGGPHPAQAKAVRLYRTPDLNHAEDQEPRLLARMECLGGSYFDNISDPDLAVRPTVPVYPVPIRPFSVARVCSGRLVAGNFDVQPSVVRWSVPGMYGTWPKENELILDGDVTAIVEHNAEVLAFTRTSLYVIDLESRRITGRSPVGCAGPQTVHPLPNGDLVWLGAADGLAYLRASSGSITQIGTRIKKALSVVPVRQLAACPGFVDPRRGLAVFPLGAGLTLGWDWRLGGWVRFELDDFNVPAAGSGPRGTCLVLCQQSAGGAILKTWDRWALPITGSTPAAQASAMVPEASLLTVPIRIDPTSTKKLVVNRIFLHVIETDAGDYSLGFYSVSVYKLPRRGQWTTDARFATYDSASSRLRGDDFPKDSSGNPLGIKYTVLGAADTSTSKNNWHDPAVVTIACDVDLSGVDSFQVSIQAKSPLRLVGISFGLQAAAGTSSSSVRRT